MPQTTAPVPWSPPRSDWRPVEGRPRLPRLHVRAALARGARQLAALPRRALDSPAPDLVPYLTFLLLAFFAPGYGYHSVLVWLLCLGGTVYRPLVRMPTFWFALATVVGMGIFLTWYN